MVSNESPAHLDYAYRHLQFGWWSLLCFATLGLVLEALHGFKVQAYLDVSNETRRLMWTLAHAHGALLSVVHVIFGLSIRVVPEFGARRQRLISRCLIGASFLLPGGFFLGGMAVYGGDPGLGVLLVPLGAVLLLIAVFRLGCLSAPAGLSDSPHSSRTSGSPKTVRRGMSTMNK
jgi:hypothetical protein